MAWGSIDWWICVPGSTWNWSVIMVLCKDFWEDQAHRPKFITSTELQSTLAWPDADAALLLLLHFCKQCKVTPTKHLQLPTKGIIEIKPAPNYSIKTMTKLPWPTFQQGAPKRWNFCGRPHLADHTPRRRHSNPPSRRPCPGLWCVALLPRPWAPSSWDVKMFPLRKARPTSSNSPNLQLFMVLMSIWIQKQCEHCQTLVVLVGFAFGLQKCSCKFFEVILSIQTKLCEFMSLSAEGLAEIPPVSFASLFQHFVQTWANGSCKNSAKKLFPSDFIGLIGHFWYTKILNRIVG